MSFTMRQRPLSPFPVLYRVELGHIGASPIISLIIQVLFP